MAQNVSTAFVTLFESEVKQAYQGEALLRGTMRARSNVQGNTVKFPKIGKGVASVRVPQTDVTPLNVTYSQVSLIDRLYCCGIQRYFPSVSHQL